MGVLLIAMAIASRAGADDAACVNFPPAKSAALVAAAGQRGLSLQGVVPGKGDFAQRIVIWEAKQGPVSDIGDPQAERLDRYVRQGGSLLLSLSRSPGIGPHRLAFMLPTTAWQTFIPSGSLQDPRHGEIAIAEVDSQFTPLDAVAGLPLPFYHAIRPFHAVERGQARYDRYTRPLPYSRYSNPAESLKEPTVPAGSHWWSRPLLNRDWRIRARGDDVAASPLLLTGRYGAGRVAVFASSLPETPDTPAARAMLGAVLAWLSESPTRPADAQAKAKDVTLVAQPQQQHLRVRLAGSVTQPVPVVVVARFLTWEGAIVGDQEQETQLQPGKASYVDLPAPAAGPTSYQALDVCDAYQVRLGVLSQDGATLLAETQVTADFRPALQLSVATPEVRAIEYPFAAPKPGKEVRLGLPVWSYAFKPGQSFESVVTLRNGLVNLAPQASIKDETQPDNPTTAALVDGSALAERRSDWFAQDAFGAYTGREKADTVLAFAFPHEVTLAAVTVVGSPDLYRNYMNHNPATVIVEIDGREVAREAAADERLMHELGRLRLPFPPIAAKLVRLRLPWVQGRSKQAPVLAEVELEGSAGPLPSAHKGRVALGLRDALHGNVWTLGQQPATLGPLGDEKLRFAVSLPAGKEANFYRLEARWDEDGAASQSATTPLMAIEPARPLKTMDEFHSPTTPELGFIVTSGFRNVFDTGTGTREGEGAGWSQPDNLIWAYAHGMKQLGSRSRTLAGRLYVSESDMRHYSTPWRQFFDGEELWDLAAPRLVERMRQDRRWKGSDHVCLGFSDRWDTGPDPNTMFSWQDFEGFDAYLRKLGRPGLAGRTRQELGAEIHSHYEGLWNAWHLERYVASLDHIRKAFAAEGKGVLITAQGAPALPYGKAAVVTEVVRGMSDDCTWGMMEESAPLTTGRQMGAMAFTPQLAMSTLNQWGYVSGALGNPQWHGPVATSEPSRRFLFDRAFRGVIRADGSYTSMHAYGYNTNAGLAYTMNTADYNDWEREQEKHSLLTPDGPLGVGLVISTARAEQLDQTRFSCADGWAMAESRLVARATQRLQEAGISVSFSANAATLAQWSGTAPLVLLNLDQFSEAEIRSVKRLADAGQPVAALATGEPLPPAAAQLFGVHPDGSPAEAKPVAHCGDHPVLASGGCLLVPVAADALTAREANRLAPLLIEFLRLPLRFPAGTCGYGFASNGRKFVVVEDWREEGRMVELRVAAREGIPTLHAAEATDHRPLEVRRDKEFWIIRVPLRPGDAALVAIEEVP